jgi:hypothetical protein
MPQYRIYKRFFGPEWIVKDSKGIVVYSMVGDCVSCQDPQKPVSLGKLGGRQSVDMFEVTRSFVMDAGANGQV